MSSSYSYSYEHSNSFNASKATTGATALYETSVVGASSTGDVVYTRSAAETDRYLDNQGISLCKSPNVIRRTELGEPAAYEQRVCLRYLKPPALPPPGALTIEEIRQPGLAVAPLIIREQPTTVDVQPPLVLRERPPTPPYIPGPETETQYLPSDSIQERSVVIERYSPIQERPRDIIIEKWLPYGPLPPRPVIRKRIDRQGASNATCTIINYENAQSHVDRKFVVVEIYNADPNDYVDRYRESLLNPTELVQQVRRVGVNEDISSPSSILTVTRAERKRADYLQSRKDTCDCFPEGITATGVQVEYNKRNTYDTTYQRRGLLFDFVQSGLFPADYVSGTKIYQKFVRPASFSFPAPALWSTQVARYKENVVNGRLEGVTVEFIENGQIVHYFTISASEYQTKFVTSSAPKLAWADFLTVLKVFVLGNQQERESDIARAFDILDQGRRGLFERRINLRDGLISSDELRAFFSIFTDEYFVDLCVYLADIDGSGQISLSEFTRLVKSGLARDVILGRI